MGYQTHILSSRKTNILSSSSILQTSSTSSGGTLRTKRASYTCHNPHESGMGVEVCTSVMPPITPPTPGALHTCVPLPSLEEHGPTPVIHTALARSTFEGPIYTFRRHDFSLGRAPWEASALSRTLGDPAFMAGFRVIMVIIPESPWSIPIYGEKEASTVTVGAVLNAIQQGLDMPIEDSLDDEYVLQQRTSTGREIPRWEGTRRLDLLGGRTRFAGLSPSCLGEDVWHLT